MTNFIKGGFCKSIAGHDIGTIYVMTKYEDGVYICDGKTRKLAGPKKKNPKHIEVLEYRDETLERMFASETVHDEDIKYSIKHIDTNAGGK